MAYTKSLNYYLLYSIIVVVLILPKSTFSTLLLTTSVTSFKKGIMAYIYKRGDVWYVRFKKDGKMNQKSCRTGSKAVADQILLKFKNFEATQHFDLPRKKRALLGTYAVEYLQFCELHQAKVWVYNKRKFFENSILPFFREKTPLKDITTSKIQGYQAHRLKSVSARTVNVETNALMALLRHAVDRNELEARYLPKVKKLAEEKGRLHFLEVPEIDLLRNAALQHSREMAAYCFLMLYAGLRSGEALSLRWADVDLSRRILHVAPREDWKPKTRTARIIPTPDELQMFLEIRRAEIPQAVLVVHGDANTPYMLKRRFPDIVQAAGLPITGKKKVTSHLLRHSYASHLCMNGTPIHTIAALLGHSTIRTSAMYAHLAPDHLHDAVKRIGY